jgi:hypothetical protein
MMGLYMMEYDGIVYDGILELILSKAKLGGAYLY